MSLKLGGFREGAHKFVRVRRAFFRKFRPKSFQNVCVRGIVEVYVGEIAPGFRGRDTPCWVYRSSQPRWCVGAQSCPKRKVLILKEFPRGEKCIMVKRLGRSTFRPVFSY